MYLSSVSHLGWLHLGFALTFLAFISAASQLLQLHIGASIAIAALRCIGQFTTMGILLQHVLVMNKVWAVAEITLFLIILSTVEIATRRFRLMFPAVLVAMLVSIVPVSILGAHLSIDVLQFWTPEQYLPVVGMLCVDAITGISVSLDYILKELSEIGDSTETLPGSSLPETYRLLVTEALRRALMPTINKMSMMGIVTIPSMMTRAILDGTDVEQAARLQMIIMFMISASNALSYFVATQLALLALVAIAGRTGILAISFIKQLVLRERISNDGHADSVSERTHLLT